MSCLVLLLLIANSLWADTMESAYEEGRNFANSVHKDVTVKATEVPGSQTATPKEAALAANGNLSGAAQSALADNEAGKTVISTAQIRERFVLDPKTDPLFKALEGRTAEEVLNIKDEPTGVVEGGVVKKTCEEGGEAITYECLENRHVVPQVPVKTATLNVNHLTFTPTYTQESYVIKKGNFWRHTSYGTRNKHTGYSVNLAKEINAFKSQFCPGFTSIDCHTKQVFNIDCNHIQGFNVNGGTITDSNNILTIASTEPYLNITLYHKTYEGEAIDEWTGCNSFEQMVDQGLCQYGERTLSQGAATRNINGYAIFKDAWQYRQIYHCKMVKDECSQLRAQGCYQVGSKCKEYKQNKCWIYEQEYHCPDGKKGLSKAKTPNSGAFCLTGNCHDASYEANAEMLDAISRLSVLKEIQNDLRANKPDVKIFKGNSYQCSRNCLSFKDCCGGMKGWGISLHLTGCKPEEKQLAQMRQQSLCRQVGNTYCAEKVLGKCVKKKTSFCCFGTKFARIIQEQGRQQLGIGWGDPKCPDCRALTIDELARIDLSKVDFREVFADIMNKYKQPNVNALQDRVNQRINENLTRITDGLTTNNPTPHTGIVYDKKDGL